MTVENVSTKWAILKALNAERIPGVFCRPDLTPEEQKRDFKLRSELNEIRKTQQDKKWTIWKGAVVEVTITDQRTKAPSTAPHLTPSRDAGQSTAAHTISEHNGTPSPDNSSSITILQSPPHHSTPSSSHKTSSLEKNSSAPNMTELGDLGNITVQPKNR